MSTITPCLWFDGIAEEAAGFYVSVFPDSAIQAISRQPSPENQEEPGQAITVAFTLRGVPFQALNGGPDYTFSEAVSFSIDCKDQQEVDHFWDTLTADGGEEGQCGWLKDKYGVSWQVVPDALPRLLGNPDPAASARVLQAFLAMKKFDIAALEAAAAGV